MNVSLEKGEATVTFAQGNSVKYEDLCRAIEKNGFVVKGTTLVADGKVTSANQFEISGSNELLRLEPENGVTSAEHLTGKNVEITGTIPEVAKGQKAEVIRYSAVKED